MESDIFVVLIASIPQSIVMINHLSFIVMTHGRNQNIRKGVGFSIMQGKQ